MHQDLVSLVEAARARSFQRIALQTNGRRLAYSGYASHLARAGVDCMELSLAGPRADIHEYHTEVPGSFVQSVKGLVAARAAGILVGVTLVITRSNFRHLAEMVEFVTRFGVKMLHMSIARPRGGAQLSFSRVVPRFELLRAPLGDALRLATRRKLSVFVSGLPNCAVDRLPAPAWLHFEGHNAFDSSCSNCAYLSECNGVDVTYVSQYGWREFQPLSGIAAQQLGVRRADVHNQPFVGPVDS